MGDTDCGGEEESGWIQTVADDEDVRERQKGGAALWWHHQMTQTEPEDFIFRRTLVDLVWQLDFLEFEKLFPEGLKYIVYFFSDLKMFSICCVVT